MKPLLILTSVALALSTLGAHAQVFIDPLDTKTGWSGPGGPAAANSTWTIDNVVVAPGSTGSFKVMGDFSGGSYVDVYNDSLGTYNFSTSTFSMWLRVSVPNAPVLWRLGSSAGVYEVAMAPTTTNTWQQFNFTANQFTGTLENLTDVNLIQLRFIGDNLGGGNADFYVDQMSIVPEPSSKVLILSFVLALGGVVFWKRFRPQTAR